MGKTVLFSPVGGSDPMSEVYDRDGSLLHVARIYSPDIIYMYMSKEILDKEDKDHRYSYCIEQLFKLKGCPIKIVPIKRPELVKVHDFDYFYNDFEKVIKEILSEMDSDDTLIFNISSGTPAMKSALLVWATLRASYDIRCVQVATPKGGMNEHRHDDENYDVEIRWECNKDNDPDEFVNRSKEIECPNLLVVHNEEIIKEKIRDYDYRAAVAMATQLPENRKKKYIKYIRAAEARMMIDLDYIQRTLTNKEQKNLFGKIVSEKDFALEYALSLDIKQKKHEYADFVRALSPIVLDLFIKIVVKKLNFPLGEYAPYKRGVRKWNITKLEGTDYLDILNHQFGHFSGEFIKSIHFLQIIKEKIDNPEICETAEKLRNIEEKVRNIAAHDLVSVTEQSIRQRTGYKTEDIMELIKKMFGFIQPVVDKKIWDSYDTMNQKIIEIIEE